ncbi:MAG TPA: glycosyltransferase family 87 protein [Candidatus Limnocylindrales bacterium]|nr:glycosyltransferase family 87 protein [Candidatus Limnocylindrales bacterium]
MTLDLEHTYGLRLLAKPRVQRLVLGAVATAVLLLRLGQFVYWTGQPQWAYDFSFYWTAASNLLHGLPIYSAQQLAGPYAPQAQQGFLYPPAMAALLVPFAALPIDFHALNWLWSGLGAAVLVWAVLALARVERLDERFELLRGRGRWWLVVAAVAFPPVIDELVVGNVHLFLVGLLVAAWIGIRRADSRGDAMAGIAIGAATIVKIFPGLLVLWFLLTRRWRAAAWSIVAVVGLAVLSLPVTGLQPWLDYPTVLANLSLTPDAVDALAPTFWLAPYLGFTIARLVVTVAGLAILAYVVLGRRSDDRIGFSTTIALSVLMTPALYTSYLTVLVVPLILGLSAGIGLGWLGLSYLLLWGGQQDALGDWSWVVRRALPTLGALLLLGLLVAEQDHRSVEGEIGAR